MAAFCDESDDPHKDTAFVVVGLLGRGYEWVELERRWRKALKDEHLARFHMAKCENGTGDFQDMDRQRRDHLQRRFIGLILERPIGGYAAAIAKAPYDAWFPRISAARQQHAKPYYLAFQLLIELMALDMDKNGVPAHERIAFVFEHHQEYQQRAAETYFALRDAPNIPYRSRMGSLSFDDPSNYVALQAADIFAYENLRYLRGVRFGNEPERWQWQLLRSRRQVARAGIIDETGLEKLGAAQVW